MHQQREPNTICVWTLGAYWCNSWVDAHRSPLSVFFFFFTADLILSFPYFCFHFNTVEGHVSSLLLLFLRIYSPPVFFTAAFLSRNMLRKGALLFLSLFCDSKYTSSILENTDSWLQPYASFHCNWMLITELYTKRQMNDLMMNDFKCCMQLLCKRIYNWINKEEKGERQQNIGKMWLHFILYSCDLV